MTRTEIIAAVAKKTENATTDFDTNSLFAEVTQEFCAEHRFWWRKKRLTLSTIAGTDTYDLPSATTTPTNAGRFVEEITFVGIANGTRIDELDPIFDDGAIAQWSLDTSTDRPGLYTIETNSLTSNQTLRVHKSPSGIYTLHVFFWAMPNPVSDDSDDTIYIVPSIWHHVLQTALEKEVWRLKYGEENPKYVTALNLYNKKVAAATNVPGFSTKKTQTFARKDGMAIRSTR